MSLFDSVYFVSVKQTVDCSASKKFHLAKVVYVHTYSLSSKKRDKGHFAAYRRWDHTITFNSVLLLFSAKSFEFGYKGLLGTLVPN